MRRFTTEPLTDADLREMLQKAMHELGEKAHLKPWDLQKFWTYDLKINFPKDPSVDIVLGATGRHIPEKI